MEITAQYRAPYLCSSPDIIRSTKPRHVAHTGNLKVRDYLRDLDVERGIILKQILKKKDVKGVDWVHLAQNGGSVASCFIRCN
jgi:hypothetical protein